MPGVSRQSCPCLIGAIFIDAVTDATHYKVHDGHSICLVRFRVMYRMPQIHSPDGPPNVFVAVGSAACAGTNICSLLGGMHDQ